MKQIIINYEELQTRVAVVWDGVLHDFYMERNSKDHLVGSIYRGKIKNLEPSLQAAFVDIGCGKNAFLHYWDMIPASQDMLEEEDENEPSTFEPEHIQREMMARRRRTVVTPPSDNSRNREASAMSLKPLGLLGRLRRFFKRVTSSPDSSDENGLNLPGISTRPSRRPMRLKPDKKGEQQPQEKPFKQPVAKQPKPSSQKKQPPKKPQITVDDIPNLFKEGQEILVQVTKGPIGTKGCRVTTNLSIPGRYLVLLPNSPHIGISKRVEERQERERLRKMMRTLTLPPNMGVICRTVGAGMTPEQFQRDLNILVSSWNAGLSIKQRKAPYCVYQEPALAERTIRDSLTEDVDEIVTDSKEIYERAIQLTTQYNMQDKVHVRFYEKATPIFNRYNLNQQLEQVYNRKVNLPSGGYICIDETEALIAIDVNSGKNRTGKDQPETILATNMEAVKEIARQLRLRNVGGLVVLDLIDMRSKADQQAVTKALKDLMAEDHAKTKVYPISPLGLVEMTRQRENESVESEIFDNCPYCKGRGLVKSPTSMSVEIQRRINEILARRHVKNLTVCVHPRVLERLRNEDGKLLESIEHANKATIQLQLDAMLHIEEYQILDTDTKQKL